MQCDAVISSSRFGEGGARDVLLEPERLGELDELRFALPREPAVGHAAAGFCVWRRRGVSELLLGWSFMIDWGIVRVARMRRLAMRWFFFGGRVRGKVRGGR